MVDKSAVGATTAPVEVPIERGKVREFARATMSENAAYLGSDAPVIPPTFLTTINFWMSAEESPMAKVGLDLRRLLHGGQEYVFHGPPPRAGSTLHATSRIEDIYEKEGRRGGTMTFVVAVTEFRDEDGALVAEARATAIETGQAPMRGA